MRYFFFCMCFIGIIGCTNHTEKTKVLSRKEFVNIIVDLHTFDAFVTDYSTSAYLGDLDSLSIYTSIMKKHNTTGESFKATMEWYSARPEKLSEVYDEVFGIINKKNQETSDELKLFTERGSHELFKLEKPILIKGDTAQYPKPFVVELMGTGTYLIDIKLRLVTSDSSENPRIVAYFMKSKEDTKASERLPIVDMVINKSNFSRDYQYVAELKNSSFKFMKIFIPKIDANADSVNKDMQLTSFRVLKKEQEEKPKNVSGEKAVKLPATPKSKEVNKK